MGRNYSQSCSLACALDRIGERWSLLIVRELSLGPLRFTDLARSVGGAPTDVLAKRLRDFEQHGIVRKRELGPPVSAAVYELTELGRGLERPMIELGRWGMSLQSVDDVLGLTPASLPNVLRVVLQPPGDFELTLGLRSGGQDYALRFENGWIAASRGAAVDPDLTLSGGPIEVISAFVVGEEGEEGVEIEGDRAALDALRSMVIVPDRLREGAVAIVAGELSPAGSNPAGESTA
ncbi:MAG TPA: helix-turn-helix domain-containing protein [Solirubrobacterales bacterium]